MRRLNRVKDPQDDSVGLVLMHGEGLDGQIWRELEPYLYFNSLVVEFPARHEPALITSRLSFDDYEKCLLRQIQSWSVDRIILVAHSLAGIFAMKLAQRFSAKLMGVVAIGSVIPSDGGSYVSALPVSQRILTYARLLVNGKPLDQTTENHLCLGLSHKLSQEVIQMLTQESPSVYFDRCNASPPWAPSMYIKLTHDCILHPDTQDRMTDHLGAREQHVIHSGHLPMLTHPLFLATIINDFTQDLISGIRPTYSVPAYEENKFNPFFLSPRPFF